MTGSFQPLHKHKHFEQGMAIGSAHCLQDKNKLLVLQEKYHSPLQEEQYENVAKKNTNYLPQLHQHGAMPIQVTKPNKPQTYGKTNRSNSKSLIWQ